MSILRKRSVESILEEARKVASYISSIDGWQEDPEWRMIALHLEKREHLD